MHEVHTHDNGLFTKLMGWIEAILEFLRHGPKNGTLDINDLFEKSIVAGTIDKEKAIVEIDQLISWQEARKKWHQDKTRQKMAAEGVGTSELAAAPMNFNPNDFGLDQMDLEDMAYEDDSESEGDMEAEEDMDPIDAERKRRRKVQDRLRRYAGEPVRPDVSEVHKLKENFLVMLKMVLAE